MGVRLYLQLDSNQYHLDREVRSQTISDSSKAVACLRLCKYLVDRRLHHVICKITFTDKVFEGVTPSILVLILTLSVRTILFQLPSLPLGTSD